MSEADLYHDKDRSPVSTGVIGVTTTSEVSLYHDKDSHTSWLEVLLRVISSARDLYHDKDPQVQSTEHVVFSRLNFPSRQRLRRRRSLSKPKRSPAPSGASHIWASDSKHCETPRRTG
ncbi:hypothetical protein [Thauera aminoaromatica]|uniref:Uncharacterized protein n=1 Tax=Thauera aminoaromatica TaxID=164330 RepID=A0A5C7SM24_THASP|nr:hypothetical protein [Thauera aminoaromatica]TXH84707.1 MAG: hypothetical protein E6Q80_10870 [Thauera aminoaromatica]